MASKKADVDSDSIEVKEEGSSKKKTKKSEEPSSPESRTDALTNSEIYSKIRKKYGSSLLQKASEFGVQKVPRIPCGIFPLDYALGGGFPAGRVNMVYGPKSASKTTSLLKTIANAQKMCANCWQWAPCECGEYREPVCAYFDVEGTFDAEWAKCHHVDLSRLILSVPDYGEQVFDIGEGLLRSGDVDIIVIDSLAFLTPAKEIEESIEKDMMGVQPRMIGKGIRKFVSALNNVANEKGRRPTIFTTNQIRMKLGVMFGNPETTPGGNAPGFANSTETRMSPGKYLVDEESGRPLSVEMRFKIEKNKTSVAKMEGEYKIILSDTETKKKGDVYDEDYVVKQAHRLGIIEGAGSSWKCMGQPFGGKSLIEREMLINPEFDTRLRETTMKVLLSL